MLAILSAAGGVSTASPAESLVVSEPGSAEYVRACDEYGKGYFFIPGTETCLSIGGYLRFETRFGDGVAGVHHEDWSFFTRAQLTTAAKSDTELGTLTSQITLRTNIDDDPNSSPFIHEAFIDIAGFRVGKQYTWWDNDRSMSGETDVVSSNMTVLNAIRYFYENPDFSVGLQLDELAGSYAVESGTLDSNNLGIEAQIYGKAGVFSGYLLASYDVDQQDVALRAIVYAELGSGQLGIYGLWASGANYYYEASEWSVGAQYAWKVNSKLTLTPGVQYLENIALDPSGDFSGGDEWRAGLTIDYKIVADLAAKLSVQYVDADIATDGLQGFLRLQRNF